MKRIAAIVIGSNSTRLLAADACVELTNPLRERVETQLFLGMSANGELSNEAMIRTAAAVTSLKSKAGNADLIGVFATSASRDAKNADRLMQLIFQTANEHLRILSGEEEARFSFLGASRGQHCGIIDIGGGSTEIALGEGETLQHAFSLQLGASRLFKTHPIHTENDIRPALSLARQAVSSLPSEFLYANSTMPYYLVGGTGTSLASLCGQEAEGFVFTLSEAQNQLARIAATPRDQRAGIPGFPPSRLDILPTGLAILIAVMEALGIQAAQVTKRVNADGLLYAYVHKKFA